MGAAAALYSATCFASGTYSSGNPYPINLTAIVGLSGWLPCSRSGPLFSLSMLEKSRVMQILISKLFVFQELKKQDWRVTRGCKTSCIFASSALPWQRYSCIGVSAYELCYLFDLIYVDIIRVRLHSLYPFHDTSLICSNLLFGCFFWLFKVVEKQKEGNGFSSL